MIEYTNNRNDIISPKGGSVINIKHKLSSDNYFLFDVLQYIYDKTCFILFYYRALHTCVTNGRPGMKAEHWLQLQLFLANILHRSCWRPWDSHGSCCGNNRFGLILMVARVWTPDQEEELVWTVA